MMTAHYLSQLLYRYQCVTVPGFGAFLTETISAQMHESTNAFYPPKKLIRFNANIQTNDGLLANHVALSEKLSYEKALGVIHSDVQTWKRLLQNKENVVLQNIGEFSSNSEGNIVFHTSYHLNYLTDSFGLTSFVSPAIQREIELELQSNYVPDVVVQDTIVLNPEVTFETKSRFGYFKYAAVLVVGLSITGIIGKKQYENYIENQTLLVQQQVQKEVQNKIQEATFFIENPLPSVVLTVNENSNVTKWNYHIVAGAFREASNAEKEYRDLLKMGFSARKLPKNKNGLYPVLYGSFKTFQEAHEKKREIHQNLDEEAWILIESL